MRDRADDRFQKPADASAWNGIRTRGPGRDVTMLRPGTIAAHLFAPDRGDRAAFVDRHGKPLRFGVVAEMVDALASGLLRRGIAPGSRIGFLVPRGPLGVIGFLATSSIGTCCPLNPRLTPNELAAALETLSIAVLLDGVDLPNARALATRAGRRSALCSLMNGRLHLDDAAVAMACDVCPAHGAAALLTQTSGTTMRPKVVALTHANILSAAGAIGDTFGLGRSDLCLNPMPLHHVHGLISAAVASLLAGSAVHCTESFNPTEFDAVSRALAPTWFSASPTMHLALREHYGRTGTRPPTGLRFVRSSSAPLPASAIAVLEDLFRAPLIETYGLTETASMVCANPLPPGVRKLGSVGVACGAEIRIVDAEGATCAPDIEGEIAIRGPSTITAYASGETDSFVDGWLLTGDIGRMDSDGYLSIVGRAKDLIKRGGLSVYPSEVDDALAAHPAVADVATFSVPHPTLGEDVVAVVVQRAGGAVPESDLRRHVAARLSTYKVPSVILSVPSIPKNETGKIVRREVAAALADYLAPEGRAPRDPLERTILDAWRAVLERDDIGVTDNVFLFGADPMRAVRVSERLAATGWSPSLKDFLAAPTVREQAQRVQLA